MTFSLVTIGVYGFHETSFFDALQAQRVDLFCDIRQRRGLRGREYAFANSLRLQKRLQELGIGYAHLKHLAPPLAVRERQQAVDLADRVKKRSRRKLGQAFIEAYEEMVLASYDVQTFLDEVGEARVVALFCVEREPEACHRSLLAAYLSRALNLDVKHVVP